MTLISILVGLGLEYCLGALDHLRDYTWFDRFHRAVELRCNKSRYWEGPWGVLLTLAVPVTVLVLVGYLLGQITVVLAFVLATAVFVYSLGPDLNSRLESYREALGKGDSATLADLDAELHIESAGAADEFEQVHRAILLRSHEHLFGIIFWFLILGMAGAMLYGLTVRLHDRFRELHGGYGDSLRHLHSILMWPSARFQALGFALAGNLVEALEAWRDVHRDTHTSADVVQSTGLAALQYTRPPADLDPAALTEWRRNCIHELQALINRTLIVWLTTLGILTLGGWLI